MLILNVAIIDATVFLQFLAASLKQASWAVAVQPVVERSCAWVNDGRRRAL